MALPIREWFDHLGYAVSLPERMVRSLVAVAGGASKIVTDHVLPRSLRKSRTYAAIVGNAQRFIIERVAEVEGVYSAEGGGLPEDYVPRKIAGNVVEAAGIFSVHLSPLWVFAIAADVAEGSRVYLNRLTDELRRDGVIDATLEVKKLDDLLDAMTHASEKSSQVFDAPPLGKDDVLKLRDQLVSGYGNVFTRVTDLMPRLDSLWNQMTAVAGPEGLTKLAGVMSMDLERVGGKAVGSLFAVGKVTGGLLGETILDQYAETLGRVQQQGLVASVDEATRPYVRAFSKQYSRAQKSWTERLLGWFAARLGMRTTSSV